MKSSTKLTNSFSVLRSFFAAIYRRLSCKVSDPHPFHADPNPGFKMFADPDLDQGFEL